MDAKKSGVSVSLAAVALAVAAYWMQTGDGTQPRGAENHRALPDYEHAREAFWDQLYAGGGRTLYCDVPFGPDDRPEVNIEHVFPMAWVVNGLDCDERAQCRNSSERFNQIEADLHNLYPALNDINYARGSMRFGEIAGEDRWSAACDFEIDQRARTVEPRPAVRGDIARAMFYMQETHGLEIFRKQGETLKQWHRSDPVSDEERRRNDAIEALQGTRNPYIDYPERVDDTRF